MLRAAVAFADRDGVEALSMRRLAEDLRVVPMALYKHVADKEALLDGMVEVVVGEIGTPAPSGEWKRAVRDGVLAARRVLLRHRWAYAVLESRKTPTPAVLDYLNAMIGLFRAGGFSADLCHHAMHALGSRVLGFTQELFDDSRGLDPATPPEVVRELARRYPHIAEIALGASHDAGSVVGPGCDDQAEFEFALDVLLDGFERLREREMSRGSRRPAPSRGG